MIEDDSQKIAAHYDALCVSLVFLVVLCVRALPKDLVDSCRDSSSINSPQ